MKKLTILLFTLLLSTQVFSQEKEFYQLYTDNLVESLVDTDCVEIDTNLIDNYVFTPPEYYVIDGDTVGITLTIEQVQHINSELEMLKLFKVLDSQTQDVDQFYIDVINNQNEKMSVLQTTLTKIRESGTKQDDIIIKLKRQLKIRTAQYESSGEQISNDEIIIEGLKKDVTKQKAQKIGAFIGAGTGGAGVIVLLILMLR